MHHAVGKRHADSDDEDCPVLLGKLLLPLHRCEVGIKLAGLLRVDEGYLLGQFLCACGIVFGNKECGSLDCLIDFSDNRLEEIEIPLPVRHHALPVPLVDVDGMDVVDLIVRTDGVHVGVKSRSGSESVVRQCHALPLCKALNDFHGGLPHIAHVETHRPLDAVQVIVDSAIRLHEQCRSDT